MRRSILSLLILAALLAGGLEVGPVPGHAQEVPTVYVVIAIDTENGDICWYPTHPCRIDPTPLFDTHNFKRSDPEISTIYDPTFRAAHVDSSGQPYKMSWFVEMDQQFEAATYQDESPDYPGLTGQPAEHTGVMDTLLRYWSAEIAEYGDGVYWHHHVQAWTGAAWDMNDAVIDGYTHHYDALNEMLVDRAYFPSLYRAGWLWEDANMNAFLDDWIPFDYSASAGAWAPYHPNASNPWSSATPNLDRWVTRSDVAVVQDNVNAAFGYAAEHGAALYSFYFHDRDNMPGFIDSVQTALSNAALGYPDVAWRYVDALDGMQEILNFSDTTPPVLNVARVDASTYQIGSDEPLWQDVPYVAARYSNTEGTRHEHIKAVTPAGANTWQATVPASITFTPPPAPPVQIHPTGVTASGEHTANGGAASNAVDGNLATWWDSAIDIVGGHAGQVPAWIQLELPAEEDINRLDIHFYDADARTYTYHVDASTDGDTWNLVVPSNTVHGLVSHELDPAVNLRFVRITVTANSVNAWAHIREIRMYGPAALAEVRPVLAAASSWNAPGWPPANAIDDNDTTWWDSGYEEDGVYSGQVPAWLEVDLGQLREIRAYSVRFYDDDTRSYQYNVQSSADGAAWTSLVPATWGQGTVLHELPDPVSMRYLHIDVTGGTTGNPHGEFAHIKEVRFYVEAGESGEPETETFFLRQVSAGASDLYGNPGTARYELPTAVSLAAFTAEPGAGQIALAWQTASEIDMLGFNLYRAGSPTGLYARLNETLIPSQAPGSLFGSSYYWPDRNVEPGSSYYYWLECVEVNGATTQFGPLEAAARRAFGVYLPMILAGE